MKHFVSISALIVLNSALFVLADGGYKATPPPLARSLTGAQIDQVVQEAPRDATVGVPGWYAHQTVEYRELGTNELARAAVPVLGAVIQDSRKNIPELKGLTDVEVAALYIKQMTKSTEELQALAPTNSLEYLIGAGMRQDLFLLQQKQGKR